MACSQIINALRKLLHLPMMDFQTKETGECILKRTQVLESDGILLNLYSTFGKIK